jgi:anti-sigma factor RsiW
MECRNVRELADSFLGEELLTETNHEILRHLETCPGCRADLAARRALRDGVRGAFHRSADLAPSPEFTAQLRVRLESAAQHGTGRRASRLQGWWALAAILVLAVGVGLLYRGRGWMTAASALARAAVGDHRNCALQFRLAEKPISLEAAAEQYGAAYRVLENLPPNAVDTAAGRARVLERHACVYEGRRFAHIVFEYRGERVSLLVTAVEETVPPIAPGEAPHVTAAGRIDNMSVVSFRAARQMVFVTGDMAQADLMKLADAVAEPLSRALAGA